MMSNSIRCEKSLKQINSLQGTLLLRCKENNVIFLYDNRTDLRDAELVFSTNSEVLFGIVDKIKERDLTSWGDQRLLIKRAPEPTDIFWENLSVDSWRRFKLTVYTYLGTFVLIAVCFGVSYALGLSKVGSNYILTLIEKLRFRVGRAWSKRSTSNKHWASSSIFIHIFIRGFR